MSISYYKLKAPLSIVKISNIWSAKTKCVGLRISITVRRIPHPPAFRFGEG